MYLRTHLFVTIILALETFVLGKLKPAQCLTGKFHKAKPGPETSNYKACHAYKDNTCCTAEFTKQLSKPDIKKIGNFSWTVCQSSISKKCQSFMKEVECFYQCSPNVGYWKGQYQGSFVGVPICSTFCNAWFDACKDDQTCAKNWITDFDFNENEENRCKLGRNCSRFGDLYGDGMGLCNSMWGQSFKYTTSKSPNDCMHLNASDKDGIKKNTLVAERFHSIVSGSTRNNLFSATVFLGVVFGNIVMSY